MDEKLLGMLLTAGVPLHIAAPIAANPRGAGEAIATVGKKSLEITSDLTDLINPLGVAPKRRKKVVSKYNRMLGKTLKKLKKKHPKTPISRLMKRAHRETKRLLK